MVGGMKRSGLREMNCQPPQKFERETKPQNSTETALFYTACYGFVLFNQIVKLKNKSKWNKKLNH
jgi:hypothetical protein